MASFTYKALKNNPKFRRLPILTLDARWHNLVEGHKTDEIKYWEKRLNELLKKQGKVNDEISQVKELKQELTAAVMSEMNEEDSPKKRKLMNARQKMILQAKEKILGLEDESDVLPERIKDANLHLLAETVSMCYDKIDANTEQIDELEEWIEKARIALKKKLLVKQDMEDMNEKIYSGMHSLLGTEIMIELDRTERQ